MAPRPPARDTAAVSAGDDADPIPPSAIGCSMSNKSHTGVRIMASSQQRMFAPLGGDLRPLRMPCKTAIKTQSRMGWWATALQSGDEPCVERIVRREHVFDLGDDDALRAMLAHEAREIVDRFR